MVDSRIHRIADFVIGTAKMWFDATDAEFDYSIATGQPVALVAHRTVAQTGHVPTGDAWHEIEQVIVWMAESTGGDPDALRGRVTADLETYAAKCRARKYVGWSGVSGGPIRYADGD